MAISRLANSNPSSNSDTLVYTAQRTILSSVIATNKSSTPATIRVWVVPLDQQSNASATVFIAYNIEVGGNNTLETFRFPIILGDQVYVRASSENISFVLSGIDDTNITGVQLSELQQDINDIQSDVNDANSLGQQALVLALIGI
jgi:outer membrane scaffolding protein for murein synthesis (MipA/OmpV family)